MAKWDPKIRMLHDSTLQNNNNSETTTIAKQQQ